MHFDDYAHMVPNLSFGTGNTFGITNGREITIRGIAGTNTTSYYINDTPLPISIDPRAIDLERIEVLRGPARHPVRLLGHGRNRSPHHPAARSQQRFRLRGHARLRHP